MQPVLTGAGSQLVLLVPVKISATVELGMHLCNHPQYVLLVELKSALHCFSEGMSTQMLKQHNLLCRQR